MGKKLIVMVGFPKAGKSTWAQGSGYPVVSRDSFGHALGALNRNFDAFHPNKHWKLINISRIAVYGLFHSGHDTVVWDWTNITKEDRDYWLNDFWKTEYKIIPTNMETCLSRTDSLTVKEEIQRLYETCDIPEIMGEQ